MGNIQIEEETELPMDIGQKPLKVLKKHGITLRAQEKRQLTHVPYALDKKNWKTGFHSQPAKRGE